MNLILQILYAHCLGDYVFQNDYIANNKGKNLYILLVHSVLYTFAVNIIFKTNISIIGYLTILISHTFIDYIKASGNTVKLLGETNALIIDQCMHYIVLILSVSFL